MNRILRPILLCLLIASALVFAACGSTDGGGKQASSDTDVDTLLANTFSGQDKKVESGKLNLSLKIDAKNTEGVSGPVSLTVSGPFQTEGKQKLPKFDIDFAFEGAGQSIKAGLISTGTKGFVNFQGSDYVVTDQVFKQFKAGYEEAQKKGNTKNQSLSSLGLDPRKWLTDAKNAGEAKVGDDDVIKITGGVDVNKLLDDINTALSKARNLGLQGTQTLPSQLTPEQRKEVTDAVKDPKVEIYTGKDDSILRRMVVSLGIVAPKNSSSPNGSADLKLDLSISDLNEDQEISEPSNPKPFSELTTQLGGLGALGALGGGSSSGSGSSSSGSGTAANNAKLEKYSKCVTDAGADTTKARKCADLLKP
jgi:hypothetical protein